MLFRKAQSVRLATLGTLFVGLVIAVDIIDESSSESYDALDHYRERRNREEYAIKQAAIERGPKTQEFKSATETEFAFNKLRDHQENWEIASYLTLGFFACGILWLALITSRQSAVAGTLQGAVLRWSVLGAIVAGTGMPLLYCVLILLVGDEAFNFKLVVAKELWLGGAILGAVTWGLIPAIARLFGKTRITRATDGSNTTDPKSAIDLSQPCQNTADN